MEADEQAVFTGNGGMTHFVYLATFGLIISLSVCLIMVYSATLSVSDAV
jgi:hypothetical protein